MKKGHCPGKESIMQANTGAKRNLFEGLCIDWQQLRSRKDEILTKERLAEIGLFASTATVLGYVVWAAAKAAENYTILGIG